MDCSGADSVGNRFYHCVYDYLTLAAFALIKARDICDSKSKQHSACEYLIAVSFTVDNGKEELWQ
ncbi:hypothetical protein [Prevotella fusca]